MPHPTYIALIADIIDSKKIKDRAQMQDHMVQVFQETNEKYDHLIVSNLTLTLGDEFQCLLKPNAQVPLFLDDLQIKLGIPFRLGLGLGQISTKINPEISLGADGQAYWFAREAINYVHGKNWNGKSHIYFKGKKDLLDEVINTLFLCSESIKTDWTDLQRQTFHAMVEDNIYQQDFVQKDFAEKLGISESSLTKRLNSGNIKIYLQTRTSLGKLLEAYNDLSI